MDLECVLSSNMVGDSNLPPLHLIRESLSRKPKRFWNLRRKLNSTLVSRGKDRTSPTPDDTPEGYDERSLVFGMV